MKGRNPGVGRHAVGASLAKSGIKPPSRTGSPSGKVVGTGLNNKTGANPEYGSGMAKKNDNGQMDQWMTQPPEPFRNSQPTANPKSYQKSTAVSPKGYEATNGASGGHAGFGKSPMTAISPVGSKASNAGRDNGKVVGRQQPRRVGNPKNQPSAKFYGR